MDCSPTTHSLVSRLRYCVRWCLEWDIQNLSELHEWLLGARAPNLYAANGLIGEIARDLLSRKYLPTPFGSLLQSLLFALPKWGNLQYHRMLVRLPDEGIIGLDSYKWQECKRLPSTAPVLLVLHGITGDSRQWHITSLCSAALAQGWRPVAMTYRGCGDLPLESPMIYSAVDTSDLHAAVERVRQDYPDAPIFLAGFSLGAMLVTKYLADIKSGKLQPAGQRPVAAVAASSPFDIGSAWKRLAAASWFDPGHWIQWAVVIRWMWYVQRHAKMLSRIDAFDKRAFWRSRSMVSVDVTLTCKVLGYDNVERYYKDANSLPYIHSICTPCLFIVSEDDPFVRELPIDECRKNQNTVLAVTRHGGHCAHLQGLWPFNPSYIDESAVIFLKAVLRDVSAT
ncbi:hypothetical protein WJX75_004869 [Coccomyxa subellipsoidea]|uniref:AB hydrolase-1 domain-containing protein n=1 Tax=Coccomyxa subellipsoidea TaxID=248742 RepID=A0ABR2YGQ4_9CHLO